MSDIKLLGQVRELFPKHQFLVYIDSQISAAFQKCSELSMETAKIEYYEGGAQIPWKVPGRTTMTDITLERGAFSSAKLFDWAKQVTDASVGNIKAPPVYRGVGQMPAAGGTGYLRQLDIQQLDRAGKIVNRWRVFNAWPTKFVAGDWDNTADEVVVESVTLTYDYFTRL